MKYVSAKILLFDYDIKYLQDFLQFANNGEQWALYLFECYILGNEYFWNSQNSSVKYSVLEYLKLKNVCCYLKMSNGEKC